MTLFAVALVLASAASTWAQPFQPHQHAIPLGNLRTSDYAGPYDQSLLSTQANEIKVAEYAVNHYKNGITTKDVVDYLVNAECLEGLFDTWGTFGQGFVGDLELDGPKPVGARMANLSDEVRMHMMEVALNEQGHALMTRHAGGKNPCPYIDYDKGFNELMAAAYELKAGDSVEAHFGKKFDPFKDDQCFVTSVLTLEELGATGNKGLIGMCSNPTIANAVAGLATSACAQAAVERMLLWRLKDKIVEPFGETVLQVFARISAYRDRMDGAQIDDQGLVNTDPRFIAVPMHGVNMIPTDVHGLTMNRSPQMNINILTIGAKDGKGGFFPRGIPGKINTPEGFDLHSSGTEDWPPCAMVAVQQSVEQVGKISKPITAVDMPRSVPGERQLTQPLDGVRIGDGPAGRGFQPLKNDTSWQRTGTPVEVAKNDSPLIPRYKTCGNTCNRSGAGNGGDQSGSKVHNQGHGQGQHQQGGNNCGDHGQDMHHQGNKGGSSNRQSAQQQGGNHGQGKHHNEDKDCDK